MSEPLSTCTCTSDCNGFFAGRKYRFTRHERPIHGYEFRVYYGDDEQHLPPLPELSRRHYAFPQYLFEALFRVET